jgi:hypothetical protein
VRTFLLVAFLAFAFVVGLLFIFRHAIRARLRGTRPPVTVAPEPPPPPPPDAVPDVARRVRILQHAPEVQQLLAEFVKECARRGVPAVAELRSRLANEPDVEIDIRWTFKDGRIAEFATLRSAYIEALLSIPGSEARDALLEVLAATTSAEEAYQIAAGLARRGDRGFTAWALDRAQKAGPGHEETATDLLTLVAHTDPEGTAEEIVLRSPRGGDPADPAALGKALQELPLDRAVATTRTILAEPEITRQGKERYLRSLCNREEPEVFASLREITAEVPLDRELRMTMAYAACSSDAFYGDAIAYGAAGTGEAREGIRERYERRLTEIEGLIKAALAEEPAGSPALESLRRHLDAQRARLP